MKSESGAAILAKTDAWLDISNSKFFNCNTTNDNGLILTKDNF